MVSAVSMAVHLFEGDSSSRALAVEAVEDPKLEEGVHHHRYDGHKNVDRSFLSPAAQRFGISAGHVASTLVLPSRTSRGLCGQPMAFADNPMVLTYNQWFTCTVRVWNRVTQTRTLPEMPLAVPTNGWGPCGVWQTPQSILWCQQVPCRSSVPPTPKFTMALRTSEFPLSPRRRERRSRRRFSPAPQQMDSSPRGVAGSCLPAIPWIPSTNCAAQSCANSPNFRAFCFISTSFNFIKIFYAAYPLEIFE